MGFLCESGRIGEIELGNRLVQSATVSNLADRDGLVTEGVVEFYRTRAQGGVGLIITGWTYVHQNGRGSFVQLAMDRDDVIPGLKSLTDLVHSYDVRVVAQLAHCGRQTTSAVTGETPLAPSAVREEFLGVMPREMTEEDIESTIDAFAKAGGRAQEAGFDGVQLHGAHGYLINQFLSPHINKRADRWGGSLENRMRLVSEIYRRTRHIVGEDFIIMIKLNVDDFVEDGLTIEESREIARELSRLGFDAIEVSGGIYESLFHVCRGNIPLDILAAGKGPEEKEQIRRSFDYLSVKFEEAYFLPYAREIKKVIDIPLLLVGGMKSPLIMERILEEKNADFISMSRAIIRNPNFPNQILEGNIQPSDCSSCNRCFMADALGYPIKCYYTRWVT